MNNVNLLTTLTGLIFVILVLDCIEAENGGWTIHIPNPMTYFEQHHFITSFEPNNDQISRSGSVKFTIEITNPEVLEERYLTPYLEFEYDTAQFRTDNYYIRSGGRVPLNRMDKNETEMFYIDFSSSSYNTPTGTYNFKVKLYDSANSVDVLDERAVDISVKQ